MYELVPGMYVYIIGTVVATCGLEPGSRIPSMHIISYSNINFVNWTLKIYVICE